MPENFREILGVCKRHIPVYVFYRPRESIRPVRFSWKVSRRVAGARCWRPPVTGCKIIGTPAQTFVSVPAVLNHNHSPWALVSDKVVYCHYLSSWYTLQGSPTFMVLRANYWVLQCYQFDAHLNIKMFSVYLLLWLQRLIMQSYFRKNPAGDHTVLAGTMLVTTALHESYDANPGWIPPGQVRWPRGSYLSKRGSALHASVAGDVFLTSRLVRVMSFSLPALFH